MEPPTTCNAGVIPGFVSRGVCLDLGILEGGREQAAGGVPGRPLEARSSDVVPGSPGTPGAATPAVFVIAFPPVLPELEARPQPAQGRHDVPQVGISVQGPKGQYCHFRALSRGGSVTELGRPMLR